MVQILDVQYKSRPAPPETNSPTERYRKELEFISKNKFRNDMLQKLSSKFDNNCLIMVDYIEHGEILYDKLTKECKDKHVYYIRGEVDIEEREKVRQLMETRKDIIIVAISKIFSTGIDIKNLHYIIFASGGKAKIKIIQSIGRGLRLHKDKERLIIFDIADNLQYGLQHVAKRIQFYENESITYATQTIKENKSS
jgi:superfamily II DNA or RNA helicase